MSRPLSLYYIRVFNLCYSGDLLNTLSRVELKNILSENFQKLEINTYTWNLGMYDTLSER